MRRTSVRRFWGRSCVYLAICLLVMALSGCRNNKHVSLTISAAASLQETLVDVESAYRTGHATVDFRNNFGSSGTLAREIEQGAPVDVFISAAAKPMDDLEGKGLIATGTRKNLLHNSLVLIAPLDSKLQGFTEARRSIHSTDCRGRSGERPGRSLCAANSECRFTCTTRSRENWSWAKTFARCLRTLKREMQMRDLCMPRMLRFQGGFAWLTTVPDSLHEPIVYPAAVVKTSGNQEAAQTFVEFLASSEAKAIFTKHGYTLASQ